MHPLKITVRDKFIHRNTECAYSDQRMHQRNPVSGPAGEVSPVVGI